VKIPCPQCGGEVTLREAGGFPACSFCGAGLVLDLTGVRTHFLYRPRIAPEQVLPLLRRWADRKRAGALAGPAHPRLVYYPFWRYAKDGPRRLVPAWSALDPAWDRVSPPDAEQLFFDAAQAEGGEVIDPTVPEAAARARALGDGATEAGDLVHLPVYEATVRLGETPVSLRIEACSGTVLAPEDALPTPADVAGSGRTAWMVGGGSAMLAAAVVIAPLGIALAAVALLSLMVYLGLRGAGRGGDA
jgi:hypothetical protein